MSNKDINFSIGIVVLIIIGYIIIGIGIAGIIGILGLGIFYLIKYIIGNIRHKRNRKRNKIIFYENLKDRYNLKEINEYLTDQQKFENLLTIILNEVEVTQELIDDFEKFSENIRNYIEKYSVWINRDILNNFSYESSELSRQTLSFHSKDLFELNPSQFPTLTLKSKNLIFYFFPQIVIIESKIEFSLVEYTSIKITDENSIYVTENSGKIIRGATPAYYNYLHERIDGGPDRRYKNNPATPVYSYDTFILNASEKIQIITSGYDGFTIFKNNFENYQKVIKRFLINKKIRIEEIDLKGNEYASEICNIIQTKGKYFILSNSFINHLKDYKISKTYPSFIQIFQEMKNQHFIEELLGEEFDFSLINEFNLKAIHHLKYPAKDISMVTAILNNSLRTT